MTKLPEINIGIVGHIDHGKTTLLARLTGKFTDTHSEELKRGITIKLGYASFILYETKEGFTTIETKDAKPIRYVSFIDAPGHEMLMATMLSGAATIDAALLIIAANEGIKPQTREHLLALQAKKVPQVIIVQTKIDLVTQEQALKNYEDITHFVKGTVAEHAPIIPVSAQQDINIDKILEAIAALKVPERQKEGDPFFLIARSFDINRPGTEVNVLHGGVLGGILKKGTLKVGDEIEIKPGISTKKSNQVFYETITTKISALHKGDENVSVVEPGASISIETELDPTLTKADRLTGCVVAKKGTLPEISHRVTLNTELFSEISGTEQKKVEPFKMKEMLMLSVNTTITVGTVEKMKGNEIEVYLNIPIVAIKNDNVGIARNINGHWRLIGLGEIK